MRTDLTDGELAATQEAYFGLKLRNMGELQARIAAGEILTPAQMIARYFPTAENWRRVSAWAKANGYTVADESADPSHMTVFAAASVRQVQETLRMRFARVIGTDNVECTSAVTPPVIPPELADTVDQVARLYAHLKPRRAQTAPSTITAAANTVLLAPNAIAQLYDASGLSAGSASLDGTGQTIVILGGSVVNTADLTAFWTRCGLPTTLAQFTEIDPFPVSNLAPNADAYEETKDLELASAMAPRANLLYISNDTPSVVLAVLMNQASGIPGIHQINTSYGLSEACYQANNIAPNDTSYFAAMAAMGITVFAASGDHGSNANTTGNVENGTGYDSNGPLAPDYPGSDPYVTAVGGTAVGYPQDSSAQYHLPAIEGGWCLPSPPISVIAGEPPNYSFNASTGGISLFFQQPSWQKGAVAAITAMRCVPDVSAIATSSPLAYAFFGGTYSPFGGTSMSSPVWTGLCALLNQARAQAGLAPLGLLGPHVYPLAGTPAFHTFTTGSNSGAVSFVSAGTYTDNTFVTNDSNGAYTVTGSYNMVTGLGSPNIGTLVADLAGIPETPDGPTGVAPVITSQPASLSVLSGASASLTVASTGTPAPTYQWYLNGLAISGATGAALTLSNVATVQEGTYSVVASNAFGSATSNAANVSVSVASHLYNMSSRGYVGPGSGQNLVAGFFTDGSGSKKIVVRGIGPDLAVLDPPLAGLILASPKLTLFNANAAVLATNTAWGGGQTLVSAFATVYAAPLQAASSDTAIFMSVPAGPGIGYTAEVDGLNGSTGIALAEIYDYDSYTGTPASRLVNISSRALVGTGSKSLVAGFYVIGSTSQTLLIRALGPGLAANSPGPPGRPWPAHPDAFRFGWKCDRDQYRMGNRPRSGRLRP